MNELRKRYKNKEYAFKPPKRSGMIVKIKGHRRVLSKQGQPIAHKGSRRLSGVSINSLLEQASSTKGGGRKPRRLKTPQKKEASFLEPNQPPKKRSLSMSRYKRTPQ